MSLSEANCTSFHYEPLDGRQIRVLHLDGGRDLTPLTGRLEHVELAEQMPYAALSYEWGNHERNHAIFLQNHSVIKITKSLYSALRDIRRTFAFNDCKLIWADAVCIDQDNIEERQRQVSIMGHIYRNADHVVTYIGPETEDTPLGLELAIQLVEYATKNQGQPDPRLQLPSELVNLGFPPAEDPKWKAFRSLVTRKWAGRCWCVQEFLLNRRIIMMCGRQQIMWFLLPAIVQQVFNRTLPTIAIPGHADDPEALRECLVLIGMMRDDGVGQKLRPSLRTLLRQTHALKASDPRDKIYSLLGLTDDGKLLDIKVDYSRRVEDLYTEVAASILAADQSPMLLYDVLGERSLQLPSWVPDWSAWRFGSHGVLSPAWYKASGSTDALVHVDAENHHLHLRGGLVDRIGQLRGSIGVHYRGGNDSDRAEWLEEQVQFVDSKKSFSDGSAARCALWKTLLCGLSFQEEPVEDDYERYFDAHRNLNPGSSSAERDISREFKDSVRRRCRYRSLCLVDKGYLGAVPETAMIGDWICVVDGANSLFVIRESGPLFTLVGTAYVHGLMFGEAPALPHYQKRTLILE